MFSFLMLNLVEQFCNANDVMLLANRICKDEVITDFEREIKKMEEVKLYSGRQTGLLQQMETFLMVKSLPRCWTSTKMSFCFRFFFTRFHVVILSEGWGQAGRCGVPSPGAECSEQHCRRVLLRRPCYLQTGGVLLHLSFILQAVRHSCTGKYRKNYTVVFFLIESNPVYMSGGRST